MPSTTSGSGRLKPYLPNTCRSLLVLSQVVSLEVPLPRSPAGEPSSSNALSGVDSNPSLSPPPVEACKIGLRKPVSPAGVGLGVGVTDGVSVAVAVGVTVGVGVIVGVGVTVATGVAVGVAVAVGVVVGVDVSVAVGVIVGVGVIVDAGVIVGVALGVGVAVGVAEAVGVGVTVGVGVIVGVGVGPTLQPKVKLVSHVPQRPLFPLPEAATLAYSPAIQKD